MILSGGSGIFFAAILILGALFFVSSENVGDDTWGMRRREYDASQQVIPEENSDVPPEPNPSEKAKDSAPSTALNAGLMIKKESSSQHASSSISTSISVSLPPLTPSFQAGSSTEAIQPPRVDMDEETILRAVVKIQCTRSDGISKSIGSGFALTDGFIVTVAHLVLDSGSKTCDVIFPKDRFPIYYLKGDITEDMSVIRKRFEEDGIDIAFLKLPPIGEYLDAKAIFGNSYPAILYPLCTSPSIIGDTAYHYGYPANYKDLNYLASMEGKFVSYANVTGTAVKTTDDGTATYRAPLFAYTTDESIFHPYAVSKVGIFYGDSGGLVFNATDACVLGTNHGFGQGTDGVYGIFTDLSWSSVKNILSSYGVK